MRRSGHSRAQAAFWFHMVGIAAGAAISMGCSGDSAPIDESTAGSTSGGLAYIAASPGTTPGTTAAEFSVSQGSATYTIPIRVPPGTNGMQPTLALSYSSQGGESWMGPGWSISGLSSITRCSATFAHGDGFRGGVHLDADDRFCLDGQRLVEVTLSSVGVSRGAAKEFRTEIESFSRVFAFPKSSTDPSLWRWTVETKAGMTSTFEPTTALVPALSFPIAKVSDRAKNTMTYQYTGADNERLLSSIVYTTNPNVPSLAATQKVEFVYEARPEGATTGWLAGRELKSSQRLRTLKAYATLGTALSVVREYRLAYATGRTQLTSVQECGADDAGGKCYAPLRLAYHSDNLGYAASQNWGTARATDTLTGDFDGDGRTDLLELKARSGGGKDLVVSRSTGTAFAAPVVWGTADAVKNIGVLKVADLNSDGRADLLTIQPDGVARAWITGASGTSFTGGTPGGSGQVWGTGFPSVGDASEGNTLSLTDLNGDGRTDALYATGTGPQPVHVSGYMPLIWGEPTEWNASKDVLNRWTISAAGTNLTLTADTTGTQSMGFDWLTPVYNQNYSSGGDGRVMSMRATGDTITLLVRTFRTKGLGAETLTLTIRLPGATIAGRGEGAKQLPLGWICSRPDYVPGSVQTSPQRLFSPQPGVLRADWGFPGQYCDFSVVATGGPRAAALFAALGQESSFAPVQQLVTHGQPLESLKHGDFDGDGRPDVAALDGKTGIKLLLSRGTSFAAVNTTIPATASPDYLKKPSEFYVGDLNGDGLDDLVHIVPGLIEVFAYNGDGTFAAPVRHTLSSVQASASRIVNTYQLVDYDGDGRTDVLQLRDDTIATRVSAYRNTGMGFTEIATATSLGRLATRVQTRSKTPHGYPILTGGPEIMGNVAGDLTFQRSDSTQTGPQRLCKYFGYQDATLDVGCATGAADTPLETMVNGEWLETNGAIGRGACSASPANYASPCFGQYNWCTNPNEYLEWLDCVQPIGNQVGDFNGDGSLDFVTFDGTSNTSVVTLGNQGLGNSGSLLATVTDGLGAVREIAYGRMSSAFVPTTSALAYPVAYARTSTMVPTRVRESTGLSANPWRTTEFAYEEPKQDVSGRGFLGFAKVIQTDADTHLVHTSTLKHKTITSYSQTFPHLFAPTKVIKGIGAPGETGARIHSESTDTLTFVTSAFGRPFPYVSVTETKGRDIDGTASTAAYLPKKVTTNTFDAYGNLRSSVSEWFTWSGTAYVADGHKKTVTNTYKAADLTAWLFDRVSRATNQAVWPGGAPAGLTRTSAFEYAASGALTKEIIEPDAAGTSLYLETAYFYDAFGNKVRSVARGLNGTVVQSRAQSVRYDAQGRFPTSRVSALGHGATDLPDDALGFTSRESHDPIFGEAVQVTDINGLVATATLDAMGRKVGELKPDGSGYTVTFGSCPTTATGISCPSTAKVYARTQNRDGSVGTVYQDLRGREIRRTTLDERGVAIILDTTYDRLGRTLTVSRPYRSGDTVLTRKNTYDALSRIVQVTEPDAKIARTEFHGLRIDSFDLLGRKSSKMQDSQGKTVRVIDTRLKESTYAYDGFENLVRTVDPAGNAVSVTYDVRGRKTSLVDPDGGEVKTAWNAFGEVLTEETAKLRALGRKREMAYDKLGRMVSRTELATDYGSTSTTGQAVTTWSYDTASKGSTTARCRGLLAGRSTLVAGVQGPSESWTFDDKCRVSSETKKTNATVSVGTVSQAYDSAGRVLRVTYPSGLSVENGYGTYGHLQKVFDTATPSNPYWSLEATDPDGNAIREKLGNGLYTHREFERTYGRLSRVYAQASATAVPTSPLHHMTFSFDAVGNLKTKFHEAGALTEAFGYDELNRLTTVTQNGGTSAAMALTYDDVGNITSKTDAGTYAYPAGTGAVRPHAMTSTTKTTGTSTVKTDYTYDEDGHLLESKIGTAVQRRMSWNSFGKAKSITRGSASVSFTYGGDHERLTMKEGTATTYYWLSSRYERHDLGGVQTHRHYIHAGPLLVGVVSVQGTGAPVARYFHHDHLGSVVATSDTATTPAIVHQSYDAHGRRRNVNGTYGTTVLTSAYRPGFTGHEMLDTVGLVNMHARLYDPLLGRFVSPDPSVQYPDSTQGFNRYTYANNNPTSYWDPNGYGFFKKLFRVLAVVVAIALLVFMPVVLTALTPYLGAWGAAVAFGAMTGALLGFATTGTLRGAAMGALQGALMAMAGNICATGPGNWFLHGVVGGTMSSIQGGDFKSGFLSAAFAAAATQGMNSALQGTSAGVQKAMNFAGTTIVGGVSAELAGGDFKTGATTAAYGYLFNQAVHEAQEYLDARDYQSRTERNRPRPAKVNASPAPAPAQDAWVWASGSVCSPPPYCRELAVFVGANSETGPYVGALWVGGAEAHLGKVGVASYVGTEVTLNLKGVHSGPVMLHEVAVGGGVVGTVHTPGFDGAFAGYAPIHNSRGSVAIGVGASAETIKGIGEFYAQPGVVW